MISFGCSRAPNVRRWVRTRRGIRSAPMRRRAVGRPWRVTAGTSFFERNQARAETSLTIEECVQLIPPHRRRDRAAAARRKAARLRDRAQRSAKLSAGLRGASSATYTFAILSGSDDREANALERLAACIDA